MLSKNLFIFYGTICGVTEDEVSEDPIEYECYECFKALLMVDIVDLIAPGMNRFFRQKIETTHEN